MPWKECHVMDERLRFVARLLEGEKMAPLCAEFGISAEDRLQDFRPVQGLRRRGVHGSEPAAVSPGQSTAAAAGSGDCAVEAGVSRVGAPKIREKLRRQSTAPHLPAISTVHAVLDRHGLVHRRRRRPARGHGHRAVAPDRAERALVRRLQGRVHARRSALLLSADDHRLRQPVPADV